MPGEGAKSQLVYTESQLVTTGDWKANAIDYLLSQAQGEAPGDKAPKYDVVSEAEVIARASAGGEDLIKLLDAAESRLYDAYLKACGQEDWGAALAIHLHKDELRMILGEDEGDELIQNAREWLAKADKPDELYICY